MRTLKDIEYPDEEIVVGIKKPVAFFNIANSDDLRQEAVNWINHFQKECDKEDISWLQFLRYAGAKEWIKDFFNIKEEDLK